MTFTAIKQSWRGRYERRVTIDNDAVTTSSEAVGTITNCWPQTALTSVRAVGESGVRLCFAQPTWLSKYLCGLVPSEARVTFNVASQALRDQILMRLDPPVA